MASTMTWLHAGRGYTTGAAGSRCYRDLVRQRGQAEADAIRDKAIEKMMRVRVDHPGGQGQEKFDVTVEGFLLAAGVPDADVARLARAYRSGQSASVDLSRYAGARDPSPYGTHRP